MGFSNAPKCDTYTCMRQQIKIIVIRPVLGTIVQVQWTIAKFEQS